MIVQRYPEPFIAPMREELTVLGFEELKTPEAVDAAVARPGTTLLVVNSVCGCAAGKARPGIALALEHAALARAPDHGVRRRRRRSHRAGARAPRAVSALVAVDRAAEGRQGGVHAGAPRHRRPSGRAHRQVLAEAFDTALLMPDGASPGDGPPPRSTSASAFAVG